MTRMRNSKTLLVPAILLKPKLWYLLNLRVEFVRCSITLAENWAIGAGFDPCTAVPSRS
jgi:hypothetical protein